MYRYFDEEKFHQTIVNSPPGPEIEGIDNFTYLHVFLHFGQGDNSV